MKNLLYKEFKLVVTPFNYFAVLFVFMFFIPSYPLVVSFLYALIGFVYMFNGARENNDMYYSCLLPVRKVDMVKARFLTVVVVELAQIVVSIPFLFINGALMKEGNLAGMPGNLTLLGEAFVYCGLFNLIFIPWFYKTGVKTGVPFVVALIVSTLVAEALDIVLGVVPGIKELFATSIYSVNIYQVLALVFGAVIYALITFWAYIVSKKRILKVEL